MVNLTSEDKEYLEKFVFGVMATLFSFLVLILSAFF